MVEVIVTNPDDPLQRTVWSFNVQHPHIGLNGYKEQSRQSNRHKWKSHKEWGGWSRYDKHSKPSSIPPDVIEQAYKMIERDLRAGKVYIGGPWGTENENPK